MNIQRRLVYGMASLTAFYAGAGQALGLGELQLQSALNQPLQAVIELQDSQGLSPSDVVVALADAEAFARSGLDRPHFLTGLSFTPVMDGQQLVIRVESQRPVREPYLNFLVQVTRSNGSLLREYTLLLDPPLYKPEPVVASATPQPQRSEAAPVRSAPAATPRQPAASLPVLQPQPGAARYQTVSGDSLWTIAAATRLGDRVSVQQQMDAINALNPHAFVNGDPARLRVGQELTLPTAQQMGAESPGVTPVSAPQIIEQTPAESAPAPQQSARLVIEDPQEQLLSEEEEQLHERLNVIEKHLRGLLDELEMRDAQIASLQTELDMLRQTRAAEQPTSDADSPSAVLEPAESSTPGAIETAADQDEPGEQRDSWLMRWWPALLALLAALSGALLLRLRREPEPQALPQVGATPIPQPITVPGSRVVDPLEGVELYLAYGRLPEAQLMLGKAIAAEPQRVDLRMRLLSVLAELGDAPGFAGQQQELRALGVDQAQIDQVRARYPQLTQSSATAVD